MKDYSLSERYDALIEYGVALEDELQLIADVSGFSNRTLDAVIYSRTGYPDWDSWVSNEFEDEGH